ncbi:MAG: hypothetical protein Barrevirus8_17 [Barrevirus sp.]|uniref:Uncharacterized protein n=1 Tax=Barrevirus sp. TaxID=2487763 RepID=A0A3G4ZSQ6_9VIRU|nr:MAG: hypothetical protein Barrevirus8_17 [Barrevirus sp.]
MVKMSYLIAAIVSLIIFIFMMVIAFYYFGYNNIFGIMTILSGIFFLFLTIIFIYFSFGPDKVVVATAKPPAIVAPATLPY